MKGKVLISINHSPQANFFKIIAKNLTSEGFEVHISFLERGKLEEIVAKEFRDYQRFSVGRHRNNFISIVVEANLIAFFRLLKLNLKNCYSVGISTGCYKSGMSMRLLGRPSLMFGDDPERRLNHLFKRLVATNTYYPSFITRKKRQSTFKALKEWSYLSPRYFNPDNSVLKEYDLSPKKYIFMREVDTRTLNYREQMRGKIATISKIIGRKHKVVISLEDKEIKYKFPENWIILEEPVSDIYSLMYYSRLVFSTGDSVAREAALLGVESYYCGDRNMGANKTLIDCGLLTKIKCNKIPLIIEKTRYGNTGLKRQDLVRTVLQRNWTDLNVFVTTLVKKVTDNNS